jgi:hypothetical protein
MKGRGARVVRGGARPFIGAGGVPGRWQRVLTYDVKPLTPLMAGGLRRRGGVKRGNQGGRSKGPRRHLNAEAGRRGVAGAERRGGDVVGIGWHGGVDGADMWGPCVSGRRERRWVYKKAKLKRESVNR